MDFSKVYHCMSQYLIIEKIEAYGFHRNVRKLVHSSLTTRKQRVKIGSTHSSAKRISNAIPQESVRLQYHRDLFFYPCFLTSLSTTCFPNRNRVRYIQFF